MDARYLETHIPVAPIGLAARIEIAVQRLASHPAGPAAAESSRSKRCAQRKGCAQVGGVGALGAA